ncbi:MAG: hydroxymethylbilane synthase, partial [Chloroflexota bacterium]
AADRRGDVALAAIGDKSLFVNDIEAGLLSGALDMAVHSLKDVPSKLNSRFRLGAILERADPRDVLLTRAGGGLPSLPTGASVGTSSLRREAQLRAVRPDVSFAAIRGNVDTRLRKLQEGGYDAIILAAAGLARLDMPVPDSAYLDPSISLPSPGQAAICVEVLDGAAEVGDILRILDHAPSRLAVEAERAFAAALNAGCQVPIGALARLLDAPAGAADEMDARGTAPSLRADLSRYRPADSQGARIWIDTVVASPDGRRLIRLSGEGGDPDELGRRLATASLERGAAEVLALAAMAAQ